MLSDFSAIAKPARAQIPVPDVPMQAILAASGARKRGRVRSLIFSGAITLAMVGSAAAFGTNIYNGVHLWLSGNKVMVIIHSFAIVHEPTVGDLQRVVVNATFPVVLPLGLPVGMHVDKIMYSPVDRPTMITVSYIGTRPSNRLGFTLFETSAIHSGTTMAPQGTAHLTYRDSLYQWRVGAETVLFAKQSITQAVAARIRLAMLTTSSSASVKGTEPMLSKAYVLGMAPGLWQIAARYAPAHMRTVLIGPQLVRTIPQLVERHRPMRDPRTAYLINIPAVNGQPDYRNATVRWPYVIAIPASGVRAINAVLQLSREGSTCACEIFYIQPNAKTYWVWEVRHTPVLRLQRYTVDARTFTVRRTRE